MWFLKLFGFGKKKEVEKQTSIPKKVETKEVHVSRNTKFPNKEQIRQDRIRLENENIRLRNERIDYDNNGDFLQGVILGQMTGDPILSGAVSGSFPGGFVGSSMHHDHENSTLSQQTVYVEPEVNRSYVPDPEPVTHSRSYIPDPEPIYSAKTYEPDPTPSYESKSSYSSDSSSSSSDSYSSSSSSYDSGSSSCDSGSCGGGGD